MQFLLGLNESYTQYRSQIMMMDPAPSVNKAYSLVLAEESQRIVGKSNVVSGEASSSKISNSGYLNDAAMALVSSGKGNITQGPLGFNSGSSSRSQKNPVVLYCDYCN